MALSTAPLDPVPPAAPATLTVALLGNPNSGKTSLFNALTGARQRVANYPGVTVEVAEGSCRWDGVAIRLVDLPGTYSLTANSPEERIAREFLIRERPDVVLQVLDAGNLERSLYLTMQLCELGVRLVLDLNMIDEAEARGLRIDRATLARLIDTEVVATVASRGIGLDEIPTAVRRALDRPPVRGTNFLRYDSGLERLVDKLAHRLRQANGSAAEYPPRWAAIKIAEGDVEIDRWLREQVRQGADIARKTELEAEQLRRSAGQSLESLIAEGRYAALATIVREALHSGAAVADEHPLTRRLDAIFLHRFAGLPIFLAAMVLLFQFVFTLGAPLMSVIEWLFATLGGLVAAALPTGPLRSLLVDGVIGGVGGVVVFLPNIVLLFMAIGVLERCGYMARAAFLIDRLMNKIGLHGRSFIPLVTGFGCSIPAIMATRTLENERDRLATMMAIPLMSCSARLPIYALLIPAFFPLPWRGVMLFSMYAIGVILAVILVKVLRITLLAGDATPFVMELPPYRVPTLKSILGDIYTKSMLYLRKAATIILAVSIVLWVFNTYPSKSSYDIDRSPAAAAMAPADLQVARQGEDLAYSVSGRLGHAMEPLFAPLGFDWRVCTALVGAIAAKEVLVAQLGIVYSLGSDESAIGRLGPALRSRYDALTGFCLMLFCLISAPCMSTVAIMRRESNSWKWPLLNFFGLTAVAWLLTAAIFQVGRTLGWGG